MNGAPDNKTKLEVFKRDQHTYQDCGESWPNAVLQLRMVIPESRGGRNTPDNLKVCCFDCNARKKLGVLYEVV